jgi:hypothetical protein
MVVGGGMATKSTVVDGFRNKSGNLSYWRIPNGLFEAHGLFLGETDETMSTLNTARSVIGGIIVIAIAICYQHAVSATEDKSTHTLNINVNTNGWFNGVADSLSLAVGIAVLVGILLVIFSRPGKRRAAAKQLCWPIMTMLMFFAFSGLIALAIWPIIPITSSNAHVTFWRYILVLVVFCLTAIPWFKSLFLVATGLFRADDGHPLLAPLAMPLASVTWAILLITHGDWHGVPAKFFLAVAFAGPVSISVLSAITIVRLWRNNRSAFPFRDGPLRNSLDPMM